MVLKGEGNQEMEGSEGRGEEKAGNKKLGCVMYTCTFGPITALGV